MRFENLSKTDVEVLLRGFLLVKLIDVHGGKVDGGAHLDIGEDAVNNWLKDLAKVLDVRPEDIVRPRTSELPPLGVAISEVASRSETVLRNFLAKDFQKITSQDALRVAVLQSIWDEEESWIRAQYAELMPGTTIEAEPAVNVDAQSMICDSLVDVAIGYLPEALHKPLRRPLERYSWRREPMVLVLSKKRLEYVKKRLPHVETAGISPSELMELYGRERFYLMQENAPLRTLVLEYLRSRSPEIRFDKEEPVSTVLHALMRIADDQGISILPKPSATRKRKQGPLASQQRMAVWISQRLNWQSQHYRPVVLLWHKHAVKKKAIEAFITCIRSHENLTPMTRLAGCRTVMLRPRLHVPGGDCWRTSPWWRQRGVPSNVRCAINLRKIFRRPAGGEKRLLRQ